MNAEPTAPRCRPDIVPGTVLDLAPMDHRGDGGRLTIRVTEIGEEYQLLPTLEWLRVKGVVVRPDGVPGDETSAWIRTAALADAVRPTGWLPPPDQ
ncbi:hypothetical protein [Catenuloplanes atrovinosus]|uniref:Uncharacterized protein n=1 Tax=Catenuloplanes atrovinosus TaxID=137266 RepID=A0AAE3YR90_9ACTN|nr:hypothetical protein [Catenuloplanes atrovinosus]MDR7278389.1 hypothetical protein [Catenuloplanes atrovinosus]